MKMITNYHLVCTFMILFMITRNYSSAESTASISIPQKLITGFTATPNPTVKNFQPLLTDSTSNFSLSFLRVNTDQLALAVVHVPSGESLWQANLAELARWGKHTQLFFNGSLVLSDPKSGVFWSTNTSGDSVVLASYTNLKVVLQSGDNNNNNNNNNNTNNNNNKISTTLWQSFDFPSDTLVENQNFTSNMSLVSLNGLYTMRLGFDFIGLYAKFKKSVGSGSGLGQIYFKHRALEVKAQIVPGHGPITVRISSDGFMGMYQNGSVPADVESFNSYQRSVIGPRRVRVELDGNLKGYYWSGSSWNLDYVAIPEPCELPNPCGPYGLCTPGDGCSCLDNSTQTQTQTQPGRQCHQSRLSGSGDLCGKKENKYTELRRTGVELPFKELMGYTRTTSYEQCEHSCVKNCSCWGILYNNGSGFCYNVDYPIETILGMGDGSKMGYFKVWEGEGKKGVKWLGIGVGLLCGAIIIVLSVVGLAFYKLCNKNRSVKNRFLDDGDIVSPGPYKDLGSCSFGSIELSSNK